VAHLTNLGVSPLNITTSHYQELHDQLDRIEQSITSLDMTDRRNQDVKGAEDGGVAGNVGTVMVAVNHDVASWLVQVAQERDGRNPAASSLLGQGATQVFTPHLYQRLPLPLGHLLKELSVVNGTDVNLLCDFLLKVHKIRQVGQLSDQTIYEVMYPYCRGELLAFVTNIITTRESFEFSCPVIGAILTFQANHSTANRKI
jgi:hypothetical protein